MTASSSALSGGAISLPSVSALPPIEAPAAPGPGPGPGQGSGPGPGPASGLGLGHYAPNPSPAQPSQPPAHPHPSDRSVAVAVASPSPTLYATLATAMATSAASAPATPTHLPHLDGKQPHQHQQHHHHNHQRRSLPTPRQLKGRYTLADFDIQRTLGTGSFGRVHLVQSRHNGRAYAIKVLSKARVVQLKQVEHTNSERHTLSLIRHPFLVNLWGTFSSPSCLFMVMDFVPGGELFTLLRKSQRFPHPVAKFYAAEVALAIDYLHGMDIIYRDLKPENILLGSDGHLKLTDFGFAKIVPDVTWTLCGTPDYLAPEIVSSKGYNKSVDWWALGVLLFEMLAGHPPFYTDDGNPMRLYEKIIAGKVKYPQFFEPAARDLLKHLLTADLTKRYGNLAAGSRDVFAHLWFAEVDWVRLARKEIPAPYIPRVSQDGDASQFERYPEANISEYSADGPDPYGHLFTDF